MTIIKPKHIFDLWEDIFDNLIDLIKKDFLDSYAGEKEVTATMIALNFTYNKLTNQIEVWDIKKHPNSESFYMRVGDKSFDINEVDLNKFWKISQKLFILIKEKENGK